MVDAHAALMEVAGHAGEARRSRELRNEAMRRAHRLGAPVAAIAEAARMSRMTVYRVLAAAAGPEELTDTSGDAAG